MTLTEQWVRQSLRMCRRKANLYASARKIIRNIDLSFELDGSLVLADAGYTKAKMTALVKAYVHVESQEVAVELWRLRRQNGNYGSVGFTTYNHFVKDHSKHLYDGAERTSRASVMGPCLQSVCLTLIDKNTAAIDVFYRTTELFKKFPADLVLIRDVLLKPFDLDGMTVEVECHFANLTAHPMYWAVLVPHIEDPIEELEKIREKDEYFWRQISKWTASYVCDEYSTGIQKFAQAMKVRNDAVKNISRNKQRELAKYLRRTRK